jgi:predicted dithiol-disulfide oxidoreductase (DUF899 family)
MVDHRVGSRQEWLAGRTKLLEAEKELTRRNDELARQRQELPWVRVDKDYSFDTESGPASLVDLFGGRSQLLLYHFMFPGCTSCASLTDGFDGFDGSTIHLENHDVALIAMSRTPIEELAAFRRRMGWYSPLVSSARSDFNYDFGVSFTDEQLLQGATYNLRVMPPVPPTSSTSGRATYRAQAPSPAMAATSSTRTPPTRGAVTHALWSMYQWLDRAPLGRNDTEIPGWCKMHDEYDERRACPLAPAHDHDRTGGMMQQTLAHGSEDRAGHAP